MKYCLWLDLWFLGIIKDYPEHSIQMPKKKPRKKELTQEQKDENRLISSIRVAVEHFFALLKKFHIIHNTYRSRLYGNFHTVHVNRKQQIMLITCGLVNLMASV